MGDLGRDSVLFSDYLVDLGWTLDFPRPDVNVLNRGSNLTIAFICKETIEALAITDILLPISRML